jgi:hypothetical protein
MRTAATSSQALTKSTADAMIEQYAALKSVCVVSPKE